MANIQISHNKCSRKRLVVAKVDLTPMVDLGFLLITFFMLTSAMEQKEVMKLTLPKDSDIRTFVPESTTLTVVLGAHDSIGYFEGFGGHITKAGISSLREVISEKQRIIGPVNRAKHALTIILKPGSKCTYKNFIDALDEITIGGCTRYFVDVPAPGESK